MEIQEAYRQKMAAQLKEWNAQINLFEAKLETTGADLKLKRAQELQELRAKQQTAIDKMHELGQASGEAWTQLRNTADKIWDDLKTGMAEAHAKFK